MYIGASKNLFQKMGDLTLQDYKHFFLNISRPENDPSVDPSFMYTIVMFLNVDTVNKI